MEPAEEQSCALRSNQLSTVLLTLVVVLATCSIRRSDEAFENAS